MRDTLGSGRLNFGLVFLLSVPSFTASLAGAQAAIPGMWRGNSVCTVKDSPCHDEQNVYRISALPGKPGWFSVTAGKVVNGKEIVMGTGEWVYDPEKRSLTNEDGDRVFRLTVVDDKMEGSLTSGGTVYRRIYLKKNTERAK